VEYRVPSRLGEDMRDQSGITLIETLVTTFVLVSGLVAIAAIFAYSAKTSLSNQRTMAATALLYEKMEQFKSAPMSDSIWLPGGNLNLAFPAGGYFDYVTIDGTGVLNSSTTDTSAPFMRLWQVSATAPRSVTIAVYGLKAGMVRRDSELIRGTTVVGMTF
jgi:Tfp pilus assembly protein PilV